MQHLQQQVYHHPINGTSIEIHYRHWHSGDEPVLALHGLADHGQVWSSLAEVLGDRYQVVAPDLRGHGESSKPDQGYSSSEIVADLQGLMVHLGWEKAHILAHSWAAKIACLWATDHPEAFSSLVLVDPFFVNQLPVWTRFTFPLLYRVLPFLKVMGPFQTYEAAVTVGRSLKQFRGWSSLQRSVFELAMERKEDGRWGSKFALAARNQIFRDITITSGLVRTIGVPALLIQPAQGINRFRWQLQPYHKYLPQLQTASIPGNHWAFLVEPEIFNHTVRRFLDGQTDPTGIAQDT